MHCISMLGSGYDVIQEELVKSFWGSTFMNLKKTNSFCSWAKASTGAYHPIQYFSHYNCHYCLIAYAFMLQEFVETLECITTPF
jgi:hypothetical protein